MDHQLNLLDLLKQIQSHPVGSVVKPLLKEFDALRQSLKGEPLLVQLEAGSKALSAIATSLADRAEGLFVQFTPSQNHFRSRLRISSRSRLGMLAALKSRSAMAQLVRSPIDLSGLDALIESAEPYAYGAYAARIPRADIPVEIPVVEAESPAAPVDLMGLLALAGEDNPVEWSREIGDVLPEGVSLPLSDLCQRLGRPVVEVWLGCLLGGFALSHVGMVGADDPQAGVDFYDRPIWVSQ